MLKQSIRQDVFEDLSWRGLVNQTTHEHLPSHLREHAVTLYCGFDPTADSLHVGTLVPVLTLRRFQEAGHRPIVLMGGATGMVGDPSGKTAERTLLDREQLDKNLAGMEAQMRCLLDFDREDGSTLVNNADWFQGITVIEFLRDIGKHFSVNAMLQRDSVKRRIEDREHGISYTEFSYMLMQAYDFLHLYDAFGCTLQIGASDQWGNIVSGMDLTRRLREGAETFGLTVPLLTKSDGTKFGKSEGGNIWLDPHRTSPYRFYQFFVNQADADTPALLRKLTFLERAEIESLEQELAASPEKRIAQRRLAEEVTRLVHGSEGLAAAERATQVMFGGSIEGLDEPTLEDIFSEVPSAELSAARLGAGFGLLDALAEGGVFTSKGEARKLIQNGGLSLNGERVMDPAMTLSKEHLAGERLLVVRKGKKSYHLLKFV